MQFRDIPGNFKIKEELLKKLKGGRIPHAQLFSGPHGNAKLPLALAFAQYLNCTNPLDDDSCGICPSCIKASKYIHPDIHFTFPVVSRKPNDKPTSVEFYEDWRKHLLAHPYTDYTSWIETISKDNKQGNITREECRSILSRLSLKAFEGKRKVLVIWLPEYLGKEGNHLLKLIEEPPAETYFLLVSDSTEEVLTTILSRTQIVKIPPFDAEEIAEYANHEELISKELMEQIVFMADGDMTKALKLVENSEDDFSVEFRNWMLLCFKRNITKTVEWCAAISTKKRDALQNFLKNGLHILRESLLIKLMEGYSTKVPEAQVDFVRKFSLNLDADAIEAIYLLLNDAVYQVERNVNAKIMLFDLSLKIQDIFEEAKKRIEI